VQVPGRAFHCLFAWLWDFYVASPHRGNGYAVDAMRLIEREAQELLGVSEL
jgi:hypothetical protein